MAAFSILVILHNASRDKALRIHNMKRHVDFWSTQCFPNLFECSLFVTTVVDIIHDVTNTQFFPSSSWAHR